MIGQAVQEALNHFRRRLHELGVAVDRLCRKVAEFLIGHGATRCTDDAGTIGQLALLIAVEQGWQQFALGQVTGSAKNHKIKIVDGDDACCHSGQIHVWCDKYNKCSEVIYCHSQGAWLSFGQRRGSSKR